MTWKTGKPTVLFMFMLENESDGMALVYKQLKSSFLAYRRHEKE